MEETCRVSYVEGVWSPRALSGRTRHSPQISKCSPTQKLSEFCPFGFLRKLPLHSQGWLNHWPLVLFDLQTLVLAFPRSGVRLIPLPTRTYAYILSIRHLININPGEAECQGTHHTVNSKGFRSSVPEMGTKIEYVFLIINPIITPWHILNI